MEEISTYIRHIFPGSLVYEMMVASGGREGCESHGTHYRDLGFRNSKNYWWRDGKHTVKSREDFYTQLLKQLPHQVHLDLLHIYDSVDREVMVKRELVFDIDVTDFVRYCKCERCCCEVCWLHIEGASRILYHLLTEILAIPTQHILWVLSGKKGIHCIINQEQYLLMGLKQKESIYRLFHKPTLDDLAQFGANLPHEFVQELDTMFVSLVIEKRRLLSVKEFTTFCLSLVKGRYPSLHYPLLTNWNQRGGTSLQKWQFLKDLESSVGGIKPTTLIILHLYYPRIDKGPLCDRKHLFKAPFSIHFDTGKIGMPTTLEDVMADGLPFSSLSLSDVVSYYDDNGRSIHPKFESSARLFETWLSQG
jgi:hypothetical protein